MRLPRRAAVLVVAVAAVVAVLIVVELHRFQQPATPAAGDPGSAVASATPSAAP